ncbi:VTC domain-containing protein [Kineothrix alysoides]|uniref:VTC domain-containing protein n=1 Tax=Kineothrix alysoides TaxID=1469948 RepID=A0A4R1QNV0_9FIRM|nr:polyphosphate polymerase domain-containing protein [Kineothrix alysoides]TCL55459.1 VTC domain-containing protein [Kineothrix alysoides]
MSQYQGTFKRYEKKYLLSENTYKLLKERLEGHMVIDHFGKTTICNIYFDTPDHQLICSSLEKPVYKEKLRLRSYGTPAEGTPVFVELKKKYKGVVYKRREEMELIESEHYLYDNLPAPRTSQIVREIDWFLKFYKNLQPAMYISYNRIAMYGIEDSKLRITFDSDILWREEELHLEAGVWGSPLLKKGQRLMEIKIAGAMPLWLSHMLDELNIYPVSFSKYGRGYQYSRQNIGKKNEFTIRKGEIKYA